MRCCDDDDDDGAAMKFNTKTGAELQEEAIRLNSRLTNVHMLYLCLSIPIQFFFSCLPSSHSQRIQYQKFLSDFEV